MSAIYFKNRWERLMQASSVLAFPDPAFLNLGVTITRINGKYSCDFVFENVRPTPVNTIYVRKDSTGDGNDGQSNTTGGAFRTLQRAVEYANANNSTVTVIKIQPGEYHDNVSVSTKKEGFGLVSLSNPKVIIEASSPGRIQVWRDLAQITAVVPGAIDGFNVYTYTTQVIDGMVDRLNLDSEGDPIPLCITENVALRTNPYPEMTALLAKYPKNGVYYIDSTDKKVYVRLANGRAADANVVMFDGSGGGNFLAGGTATTTGCVIHVRDLDIMGRGFRISGSPADTLLGLDFYAYGVRSLYQVVGHGFTLGGFSGKAVTHSCVSKWAGQDGINYTHNTGYPLYGLEIDCVHFNAGFRSRVANNSYNASSAHKDCVIIRLNGDYSSSNSTIHDIQNTKSFNVANKISSPTIKISDTDTSRAPMRSGFPGLGGTKMWFIEPILDTGNVMDVAVEDPGSQLTVIGLDINTLKAVMTNGGQLIQG